MWIRQLHANRNGSRLRFEGRVNIGNCPRKLLIWIGVDPHSGLGTGSNLTDVLLKDIGNHPYRGQIGNLVKHFSRHKTHALNGLLLGNDARNW